MRDGFIKIAAATPDLHVADCAYNTSEIVKLAGGLLRQLYDLRGIICTVRDVQIRRCRGNFDKSISHR